MIKRKRNKQLIFITLTLIIGLSSRKFPQFFPDFLAEYLGDTLWALLVFWLLGYVFIQKSSLFLLIVSLAFSYSIEISQLYHSPWIDSIRETTLGALVLGHSFLWTDIVCYTIGAGLGFIIEFFFIENQPD